MISIESDTLRVDISPFGGEKKTLIDKVKNRDYLWNSDPIAWKNCAIPLFPIVGKLEQHTYIHEGNRYELTGHGLARHYLFEVESLSRNRCVLVFNANEETLQKYPFLFSFYVTYELDQDTLITTYEVKNTGNENMIFTVGGHPAFKIPLNPGEHIEDYYVEFEQEESNSSFLLTPDGFSLKDHRIVELKQPTFSNDAIIFEKLRSKALTIVNTKDTNRITVEFPGFPYLAIWASNNWNHLLAIEPWFSHGDLTPGIKELKDLPGMMTLLPNECFTCHYKITVGR